MKIRITIHFYGQESCGRGRAFRGMLNDVFGTPGHRVDLNEPFGVTCTPEQFAEYIHKRNKAGFTNGIKDMCMKITYTSTCSMPQSDRSYIKHWDARFIKSGCS